MTWREILVVWDELYEAAKAEGVTQATVAARGGLSAQNVISKMTANRNLGPQVETFVRAVEGLGLTPSAFFAIVELRHMAGVTDQVNPSGNPPIEISKIPDRKPLPSSSAAATNVPAPARPWGRGATDGDTFGAVSANRALLTDLTERIDILTGQVASLHLQLAQRDATQPVRRAARKVLAAQSKKSTARKPGAGHR